MIPQVEINGRFKILGKELNYGKSTEFVKAELRNHT